MTIVMEEDSFTISSSPHSNFNYQLLNASSSSNTSSNNTSCRDLTINIQQSSPSSTLNNSNGVISATNTLTSNGSTSTMNGSAFINSSSSSSITSSSSSLSSSSSSSNSSASDSPVSSINESTPFALFIFRSNNGIELFDERRIGLDKPCKIGRSVAKIRPEPNNAIFDCKVLSRNHALLWYENSKFYIQDTKSSNGTFLNGSRLGKSNEDSVPYEISSGDIVQFGVDVTENTKKVTHGCITVELRLFHRAGVEATNKNNQQANKVDIQTQELYQLALFLQEAIVREQVLNQKINSLQTFIEQAKENSENGWLTLIEEDRLLSRIDFLEKQTVLNTKSLNEENLVKMINTLREEKFSIESSAKAEIKRIIEEKKEMEQKFDELKSAYQVKEEECNQIQRINNETKNNLIDLASKYQDILGEVDELKVNLNDMKAKYQERVNQNDLDKQEFEAKLNEMEKSELQLNTQIESLTAEKDFQAKRLDLILNKMEQYKTVISENGISLAKVEANGREELNKSSNNSLLNESDEKNISRNETNQVNHTADSEDNSDRLINVDEDDNDEDIDDDDEARNENERDEMIIDDRYQNRSKRQQKKKRNTNKDENIQQPDQSGSFSRAKNILIEVTDTLLNKENVNHVSQSSTSNDTNSSESIKSNGPQSTGSSPANNSNQHISENDENLYSNHTNHKEKSPISNHVSDHLDSLERIKTFNQSSKRITSFSTSITQTDQDKHHPSQEELDQLRNQLASELNKNTKLSEENKQLKAKLTESFDGNSLEQQQQDIQIKYNKLKEELRENLDKLSSIEFELNEKNRLIDTLKLSNNENNQSTKSTPEKLTKNSNEYLTLREECLELKNRLEIIENEMKKFINNKYINNVNKEEKQSLMVEDCDYLEQSYLKLKELKENLVEKETKIELNLTDAQKEADQNRDKLIQITGQLKKMEETCELYKERLNEAEKTVSEINNEYDSLSLRTKIVSYFSTIPLFILIFAIMVAFYPLLATITATGL